MAHSASIIGLGNWGTALAQHLSQKGVDVIAWTYCADEAAHINTHKKHPQYLKEISLSFPVTAQLKEAADAEFVVLAFPSEFLGTTGVEISKLATSIVVSAIKGFEERSHLTPLQLIHSLNPKLKTCVLSGPSFAVDVVHGKPCGVVAGSSDITVAEKVADLFSSQSMRVYPSDDPLGVELGGAIKNVIAVAAGVCDGLMLGDSARCGLITRGLSEMTRLAVKMGAKRDTLTGLSGLGDLIMTASSKTSRNYTVGLRLGQGESLSQIIQTLGSVAEGVATTPIALKLAKEHGIEMPITESVSQLILGTISPKDLVKHLMMRPRKREG